MRKQKDPIRLRSREVTGGNKSLYLDIYSEGRRSYEYLRLYLVPEKTPADREKNRETERLAKAILAKRIVELQNGRFGFENTTKGGADFFAFAEKVRQEAAKRDTKSHFLVKATIHQVENYTGKKCLAFRDINRKWLEGFILHLQSPKATNRNLESGRLAVNTQRCYWRELSAILGKAVRKGIIDTNPCQQIEPPKKEQHERVYLTLPELRRMANTPCKDEVAKRAFLFSCLTGMRKSDVERLTWEEVAERDGGTARITFRQKKTGGLLYHDISREAREFMGARQNKGLVFDGFNYAHMSKKLQEWAKAAGVRKPITYHSSRHTFALLLLDQSTDIYTVSKLLGHTDVKTTQIYAHILDKKKQEAIASLPSILDKE